MAPAAAILFSRDFRDCTLTGDGFLDENSCYVSFWSTRAGIIVKWTIFLSIIAIVGLYLLLGYTHAQRRIRNGLPPLAYHRFLVTQATTAQVDPRYRYPQPANIYPYRPDNQFYDMNAMPPPVYDPNAPRPPKYEPPAGSTKVDQNQPQQNAGPTQTTGEPPEYAPPTGPPPRPGTAGDTYAPPAGPPPSTVRPQGTGNTNPFLT